jgi:hypothetical protein
MNTDNPTDWTWQTSTAKRDESEQMIMSSNRSAPELVKSIHRDRSQRGLRVFGIYGRSQHGLASAP